MIPLDRETASWVYEAQWANDKTVEVDGVEYTFVDAVDEMERRWLMDELIVFEAPNGDLVGLRAQRGLTEGQWCRPFEHMLDDEIGLYPVKAVQTVTYEVDE